MFTGGISRRGLFSKSRRNRDQILRAAIESLEPRRLLSAGTLDTSFNNTGVAISSQTGPQSASLYAMVEQGSSFIVGATTGAGFGLARYLVNGSLDTSFGNGGVVQTGDPGSGGGVALTDIALVPTTGDAPNAGDIVAVGVANTSVIVVEYTANGAIDPSFNSGNPVVVPFGGDAVNTPLVAADSNGNIVVAGSDTTSYSVVVARITPDGSADSAFDGNVSSDNLFAGDGDTTVNAIALTSTNQIVLVGKNINNGGASIAAAWLNSDGTLNTAFAGGTVTGLEFANNAYSGGTAVAIDSGDGLVIAGTDYNASAQYDFGLIRVNSNGLQDSTFNGNTGSANIDFGGGSYSTPTAVAIESTGQIVVVGEVDFTPGQGEFGVAVLNGDGTGASTTVVQPAGSAYLAGPIAVAVDSGGDILLAGTGQSATFPPDVNSEFAFGEVNSSLSPDNTLNGDGAETVPFTGVEQTVGLLTATEPNGKILEASESFYGSAVYLTQYNSDGTPDATFGSNGTVVVAAPNSPPSDFFIPYSLAVGSDGTIYLAGDTVDDSFPNGVLVFSYLPNGTPNPTFGGGGEVSIGGTEPGSIALPLEPVPDSTPLVPNYVKVGGIAVDTAGNLVVAGSQAYWNLPTLVESMFVARLTPEGGLDPTFNGNETELVNFNDTSGVDDNAVAITPGTGTIVIAGVADNLPDGSLSGAAIARLNPNGGLDPTFNPTGAAYTGNTFVTGQNQSGEVTYDLGADNQTIAASVAIADDGSVVIGGQNNLDPSHLQNFLVAEFTPGGALDATYDPTFDNLGAFVNQVAIDQSGNVVAVGSITPAINEEDSILVDLGSNLTLNGAFAGGGVVISDPGGVSPGDAQSVSIDAYNRIIVGGITTISGQGESAYVARYTNGILSTSLSVSAPTVVYGNSATLTASVVSGSPVNTGTVMFTVTNASDVVVATLTEPVSGSTAAASVSSLPAGIYAISAAYADTSGTFNSSTASTTLTVQTAPLTISVNDMSITYGTAVATYGATYTGFVGSDGTSNLAGSLVFSTSANQDSPVGNYGVSVSGVSSPNYTITFEPGTLTIVQAALTINVVNTSAIYGAALPAFSVSYSGFENSDDSSVLVGTLSFSTSASQGSPVGVYDVSASGLTATNYAITFVDGSLSITPASLTVSVNNSTAVYGAGLSAFSVSFSQFVGSDSPASLGGSLSFNTTAPSHPGVGTYSVSATGLTSTNYTITYQSGSLTITAAPLSVSVNNATRNFGAANPTFTGTITGLQYSDSINVTYSTSAGLLSPAGNYAINATVTGAALANYNLTVIPGTLTVTPIGLNLTVTVNNATRAYGAANPTFTGTVAGAVGGDTFTVVYSTTATVTSPVGNYAITASVSGADLANYNLIITPGTLVITKAALSIAANPASKVYGQANPTLTGAITGIKNGDNITATYTTTATTSSGVGSYTITPVVSGSSGTLANYNLTVTTSTLTVTKAALTITAVNQTKVYGSANPALTVSYSGFVNGDTSSVLTHAPVVSTTATTSSNVGSYPITVSAATAANYAITFVAGTLNVTKETLYVIADSTIKFVGQNDPAFQVTYSGFVLSQNSSVLGGALVITTTAAKNSPIGIYLITASGLTSSNYNIVYIPGILLEL